MTTKQTETRPGLEALEMAAKLIDTARLYFPKSLLNHDKFDLELTCAAVNKALALAKDSEPTLAQIQDSLPPNPPRVIVVMEGGLVQGILSDAPLRATVLDYDVEGADLDDLVAVPQSDGEPELASLSAWDDSVEVCPDRVTEILERSTPAAAMED